LAHQLGLWLAGLLLLVLVLLLWVRLLLAG
jgi:hypothetical protein